MLSVRHLTLRLGNAVLLNQASFQVAKGEVVTLMGPSGCGKSSLLSWAIGALPSSFQADGELWLDERRVDRLPTAQRRIGILFQDALLFDHFSVGQNLLLALPPGIQGAARKIGAERALARAGLEGFYSRDPATLSGGQRARVALLRALLAQPQALLLDEPFGKLDASLRDNFRQWVFAEVRRQGIPVLQVTHDAQDVPPEGRVLQMAEWA